jgi:hypothetical protein
MLLADCWWIFDSLKFVSGEALPQTNGRSSFPSAVQQRARNPQARRREYAFCKNVTQTHPVSAVRHSERMPKARMFAAGWRTRTEAAGNIRKLKNLLRGVNWNGMMPASLGEICTGTITPYTCTNYPISKTIHIFLVS